MLTLHVQAESLAMKRPFVITGYIFHAMPAIVVTLSDGFYTGRGEASGVYYLGDDTANMLRHVESARSAIEAGATRQALQTLLPPGGARNALDCALWDLEAARASRSVWQLAGFSHVEPLVTTLTAGADAPALMAADAASHIGAKAIKLKLTGVAALDIARVQAVRAACPDVWLGVDANQGYTIETLDAVLHPFTRSGVSLIEQPVKRGDEATLDGFASPIPLAADESVLSLDELEALVGRFQVANVKLDKCGGLTEALAMARRARELGLGVMVGNMAGTSWAMAPAFVVGQLCEIVDLDGPIALRNDRSPAVEYRDGTILCGDDVWGTGVRQAVFS